MIRLTLPSQLAGLAGDQRHFLLAATDLREAFARLDQIAPMVRSQLFERSGAPRQFVGLFVNERQLHWNGQDEVVLHPNSAVVVVQSVAGG